ncbi:MAG: bifunctional folylpolyglutamate synthase/dihydrofolate synthase [Alphaproteobacteria bacterium]|jgi:dihydrofolate synthase/folylpolyglutamate synthase|nr:bifunctional folylpolyglutamate synthase/dihydrofolate synthase [Alphaproteobacteria bacterium]
MTCSRTLPPARRNARTVPRDPSPRVTEALARLQALHPKRIDLSLGRIRRLLQALGHPERRLPPVVHVAGTNGKGSTLAFLRAMLEAAGYRVHVYTSPHLLRFNERIRLAGRLIADDHLADILDRTESANQGAPITYFEVTTAAAFLAFAEMPADILLLETGLGGRLDATNVVDRPAATAITRISYDHMQFLGETLAEIAGEKAGILKPGVPCVLAPQRDETVRAVIAARARDVGATLRPVDPAACAALPAVPGLAGAHQAENAATARMLAAVLQAQGFRIAQDHVATGIARPDWPGRLQAITEGPLAGLLPPGATLWFDGGHNDSAGAALAAWAASRHAAGPLHLIVGMSAGKSVADFMGPLAPLAASCRTVPLGGESAFYPPAELATLARAAGLGDVRIADDVAAALHDLAALPPPSTVLICGSLYLAGAVLADPPTGPIRPTA